MAGCQKPVRKFASICECLAQALSPDQGQNDGIEKQNALFCVMNRYADKRRLVVLKVTVVCTAKSKGEEQICARRRCSILECRSPS